MRASRVGLHLPTWALAPAAADGLCDGYDHTSFQTYSNPLPGTRPIQDISGSM